MHIPSDKSLKIKVHECFDLTFDQAGRVTHDDHNHLILDLIEKDYSAGETVNLCGKSKGTVKITFKPKRHHELDTTHTILVGD